MFLNIIFINCICFNRYYKLFLYIFDTNYFNQLFLKPRNIKNRNICYKNWFSEYCRCLGTKWTKCRGCMKLPRLLNICTSLDICYNDRGEHTHRSKTILSLDIVPTPLNIKKHKMIPYNDIILTFLH